MSKLIIEGGHRLAGSIHIPGAKNAATPILAACLLTAEECTIRNLPEVSDVAKMLEILRWVGAQVVREGKTVRVKAENIQLAAVESKLVKAMRSSVLLFGPLLARLGEVRLPEPGGCIIGRRPLDAHFDGLKQLGAQVDVDSDVYHLFAPRGLKSGHIVLPEFSVTATENVLMAAAMADGQTVIDTAAAEPHVQDLCAVLVKMGAQVTGFGTHQLRVEGAKVLKGFDHTLIPDATEAGTWAVLGALTKGELEIGPVRREHFELPFLKLRQLGVACEFEAETLRVRSSRNLRAFKLQALPYPGFPTELQAPFSVLATQAHGTTLIHDPLYEGRMNHIAELVKMGADAVIADPHRVIISGPTPLYGREIRSFDLRAGATLIIAALAAQGETVIHDIEIVDRGYEHLDERLQGVGAKLRRE